MLRVLVLAAATAAGLSHGAASSTASILGSALRYGATGGPAITVGQLVRCLEHDPVPLRARHVSDFGDGRYTLTLYNTLEQYTISLSRSPRGVRLVAIDRDNGPRLATPAELQAFARRACGEAVP